MTADGTLKLLACTRMIAYMYTYTIKKTFFFPNNEALEKSRIQDGCYFFSKNI